jgi:hypothetical protein
MEMNKSLFGDKRLDKRLSGMVSVLIEKPNTCIPQAAANYHQAKAYYRFWDNKKVQPPLIMKSFIEGTVKKSLASDIVLAIQDTTDIDYTSHQKTKGLGYLETPYQLGIKSHTCLSVNGNGLPLGILWQRQWVRDLEEYGKKKQRKNKPTNAKESQRWIDCQKDVNSQLSKAKTLIHITDREGDIYEFLSLERSAGQHILLRFAQDRCIEGEQHRIKTYLDSLPVMGSYKIKVGRKGSEHEREAELSIKYGEVTILCPAYKKGTDVAVEVTLTAIRAYETNPETGEPIEWYLLTSLPVNSLEDVKQIIKYYTYRWLIERYFFVLKSGCQVEKLQLENESRLENACATYSLVAFQILYMKYLTLKTPDEDASVVLSQVEINVLKQKFDRNKQYQNLTVPLCIAMVWVARLGGFMGRKSDGVPGVKTIWRGMLALHYIIEGIQIAEEYNSEYSFRKTSLDSS